MTASVSESRPRPYWYRSPATIISPAILTFTLLLSTGPAVAGAAEKWAEPADPTKTFSATLRSVHGPLLALETPNHRTRVITLDKLSPVEALRVETFLKQHPEDPARTVASSESSFTREIRDKLVRLRGDKLVPLAPSELKEPRFYVLYFSAGWCGPCHRFTPTLVSQYNKLKADRLADFEVIFVSSDDGPSDMQKYMREMSMPWPAVSYAYAQDETFRQFAGAGIPCIAVVDREGMLLFHSYMNGEYVGADEPWDRLGTLLPLCRPDQPKMFRPLFLLHLNARLARYGESVASPKAYAITPIRAGPFREAGVLQFNLKVRIAADGTVIGSNVTENLPAALAALVESEARNWLFLPKVDHGRNCPSEVSIPMNFAPRSPQVIERDP